MSERQPTLRERQRTETRRLIQTHAVRLFTGRGYDAVTVADVAEAAGVSAMTVYRHFPTKEDLVLVPNQPARLIAERVAASSPADPLVRRVGGALVEAAEVLTGGEGEAAAANQRFLLDCLQLMVVTPALRARHLDSQYALQQTVIEALGDVPSDPDATFRAQAATSACLAAMHTAMTRWAEEDGRTGLSGLIALALTASFGDAAVPAGRRN
ncbi:TetR/AcrR family transcriptional regulator [Streptomyces cocklensis]|jgi:AcrR family transcriptional regulator|uniref:TetR family transcriptional regulator n=1 Tax=Actinacidiphila cocklensis TaxID=887465 RepID=A0A9W4DZT2_9ACTN|nr:helix-turn-helix domain-containing protein [Actinacidiphila cocklensis]MDD1058858.1 TetR/AcrR family transcriptional regulator [Actinacidiphila cocklensis]WSX74943.1 TetR/AcrR family transcriptional regulator [Streptomyces sp. NBC_00899]CAG6398988.1 TetR family transcriptional regulator [Actinacidiphila cocklensis]